jgi:hypothetical protein
MTKEGILLDDIGKALHELTGGKNPLDRDVCRSHILTAVHFYCTARCVEELEKVVDEIGIFTDPHLHTGLTARQGYNLAMADVMENIDQAINEVKEGGK